VAKEFKLPEVGEGVESGTVVGVLVSAGDTIEEDQPVLELETDKAVVEVPSSVAGRVESVAVAEGDEVAVGQTILTVSEEGAADAEEPAESEEADAEETEGAETGEPEARKQPAADESAGEKPARAEASATEGEPQTGPRAYEAQGERQLIPAAPSVRRLAREKGVDIRRIEGSGILGRISGDDVLAHAEGRAPARGAGGAGAPAPRQVELPDFSRWGEVERTSMSGIRKATVRSMSAAWGAVPMVTHFDKADITEFEKLRKRFQPKAEARGAKLTPTAMLLKVIAAALRRFPDFNASIDVANQEIVHKKYVNIGVAVDTEYGLLVPVIKSADEKNMIDLAVELGELAEKARDRKLSPDEMQGGNFSVSNLGGIGGTGFTPIVNPPDVAILGVSRGTYEPVYDRDSGEFEARLMMPLAVTYDHRLIDGAQAARFLRWVCEAIEEPFLMSLEG
jgi:pyruvate dehydrogenase E2 component (dihydrolipoamide acetyltransferase)